jgi:methionyl-tRNA formyltransferase
MGMKVMFITPEEPSVVTSFYRKVLPEVADQVAAMAVVRPIYKNSSWTKQAKRFIRSFGWQIFVLEGLSFAWDKLVDRTHRLTGLGEARSVAGLAKAHGIRVLHPDDVNGQDFLNTVREIAPDLIISVACPLIFKDELLKIPRLACVNVHSSLLPLYRGMLPTFWVLLNQESETGVTVMYMNPGIDDGDIILQQRIPITDDESLRSLMAKCKSVAADLILETIGRFESDNVDSKPNPAESGSYFSFPTKADVKRFRALGRAVR